MKSPTFDAKYGPWALIAGASEGIGEEFSKQLAAKGLNLVLIARRQALLDRLRQELEATYNIQVICLPLDLGRAGLYDVVAQEVQGLDIGLLVYNACFSTIAPFIETDLASTMQTVDVNCRGPLTLVSLLAKPMLRRRQGGIILMSSASGFQGATWLATYAASKAFTTILAESLWEEFRAQGVDVMALIAGATNTPNFKAVTPEEKQAASFPMEPRDVVHEGLRQLGKGPRHIAGRMNRAVAFVLNRLLPRRVAVAFMGKQLRKIYQRDTAQ
jgi:short-subunit dehydrogenase